MHCVDTSSHNVDVWSCVTNDPPHLVYIIVHKLCSISMLPANAQSNQPIIMFNDILIHAANGHCGIKRAKSNESRYYTDPATCITYNCVIKEPKLYARKVTCEPRCDKNGRPQICRMKKNVQRRREFKCTPAGRFDAQGYGTIYRDFFIQNQSQCECYSVNEVDMLCPTVPPSVSGQTTTTTAIPSHISNLP